MGTRKARSEAKKSARALVSALVPLHAELSDEEVSSVRRLLKRLWRCADVQSPELIEGVAQVERLVAQYAERAPAMRASLDADAAAAAWPKGLAGQGPRKGGTSTETSTRMRRKHRKVSRESRKRGAAQTMRSTRAREKSSNAARGKRGTAGGEGDEAP